MLIRIFLVLLVALGLTPGASTAISNSASPNASPAVIWPTASEDFSLEFFPVSPYHVGDHLSLRVTYTGEQDINEHEISISLADQPGQVVDATRFSRYSTQATFFWFLDTREHQPGFLKFLLEVPEMNLAWETGVNLLPNPGGEPRTWAEVRANCCIVHYITGTDAEEDIAQIQEILEDQTSEALAQFESQIAQNEPPMDDQLMNEPLVLALIPSVIGQGGFATDIAVITYSDRNWTGTDFSNIIHHEVVHVLDRKLNDGPRPSLFAEGLAVYFAGGHYRDGDTLQRAAALLAIGRYIPITDFVDDFYAAQHEISYLEAGGLVAYLSTIWGGERFLDFYFNLPEATSDSESISQALEAQYGMTLEELEADYIEFLRMIQPEPEVQDNVRLTIKAYDTMRLYQQLRIPSAYFRNAWWPAVDRALELDIVGDYAPREKTPVDVFIENLFLELYRALDSGDIQSAEETLAKIHDFLDLAESQGNAFSHYSIGWPLPHPARVTPGY